MQSADVVLLTGIHSGHDGWRPAKVPATHGDVDADGRNSPVDGWPEPDGPVVDDARVDAERQPSHDERYVDERHGHERVPGHGLDGRRHVGLAPRGLPSERQSRARRVSLLVTLGRASPTQAGEPARPEPSVRLLRAAAAAAAAWLPTAQGLGPRGPASADRAAYSLRPSAVPTVPATPAVPAASVAAAAGAEQGADHRPSENLLSGRVSYCW